MTGVMKLAWTDVAANHLVRDGAHLRRGVGQVGIGSLFIHASKYESVNPC